MSRYAFTYTVDGVCQLYEESTAEEDKLDVIDTGEDDEKGVRYTEIAVGFTGNGYLAFWKRCHELAVKYKALHPYGHGKEHYHDLWYDEELVK